MELARHVYTYFDVLVIVQDTWVRFRNLSMLSDLPKYFYVA